MARSQLHVRETGGNNFGREIGAYLAYVKLEQGHKYCAAYVSWVFGQAGFGTPRTAWSPDLFPLAKRVRLPAPADVLGIYSGQLKRIVHCGIVEETRNNWIIGIEANTNVAGSRDGDGVYRKWRHKRTIKLYARWLPERGAAHE